MAEKTEKATPKKLKDARKKGQVAKIQDLPSAFTFIVSIGATLVSVSYLFEQLGSFLLMMFREVPTAQADFESKVAGYFSHAMEVILNCSLPIMVIVCLVGVIISFLVVGPVFSFEAMKFDLKKLNPVEGLKQKFKVKVLVDLLKSIAKITGAAIIIYILIWSMLPQIISTVMMPILAIVMTFSIIFTFADFQLVYAITRGGPVNSTHLLATLAFQRGIAGGELGEGAAIAVSMIPFLVFATLFSYFGLARRKWQQGEAND